MKKTLLKYFTVALITISTISMPLTVKAAQKSNISIRPNVAYSKYDITGCLLYTSNFGLYVSGFWHIHAKTPRGIVVCEQ